MEPVYYFFLVFIGIIFFAAAISYWLRLKRDKDMKALSTELAFSFNLIEGLPFAKLNVFQMGRMRIGRRFLKGSFGGKSWTIFDYRYTTGSGKNQSTTRLTLFLTTVEDVTQFRLTKERWYHKIAGVFGNQDIDFPDFPEFSKKFLLQGKDEALVRKLFTQDLLYFFRDHDVENLEGNGKYLAFYEKQVSVKKIHGKLEEFSRIANRF